MSDIPSEITAAPTRNAYVLVAGPESPDRSWAIEVLRASAMETFAATEGELLATRDIVPPGMLLLDDAGTLENRRSSQRRLGAHPGLQGVPLVILAYEADIESYSDAIARGAAAYLLKPAREDELIAVAQRLCHWSSTTDHSEKRRRLRRPLLMKVDVEIRSRKVRVPGQIVDASGGGCRVELADEIPKGELVRLILHGHQGSTHVALGGDIRWNQTTPAGVQLIGVRFSGTTAMMAGQLLGFAATPVS